MIWDMGRDIRVFVGSYQTQLITCFTDEGQMRHLLEMFVQQRLSGDHSISICSSSSNSISISINSIICSMLSESTAAAMHHQRQQHHDA